MVVTQYPRLSMFHRVLVLATRMKKIATIVDRRPKARTTSGKKNPGLGIRPARRDGDRVDADAQDHRADVLGGRGFEEVGATTGAVSDVVADEVGDHAALRGSSSGCPPQSFRPGRSRRQRPSCRSAAELGEEGHDEAPKPKPTIRKGAWLTVSALSPPYREKMP